MWITLMICLSVMPTVALPVPARRKLQERLPVFEDAIVNFEVRRTTPSSAYKLTAFDAAKDDRFGESVAISGDRIVVGAHRHDADGTNSGSAYIFDTEGNEIAKLTAGDAGKQDRFGSAVAISGDRIVVGAPRNSDDGSNSGSAYIFDTKGNQIAKLTAFDAAKDDRFGESVAISGDRIIVGAPRDDGEGTNSGSAYVFDTEGNHIYKLTAGNNGGKPAGKHDRFGSAVAILRDPNADPRGRDATTFLVGAPGSGSGDDSNSGGSAYVFDAWGIVVSKLSGPRGKNARFGESVAIGSDSPSEPHRHLFVVGAPGGGGGGGGDTGSAYIFGAGYFEIAKLTASDASARNRFGSTVAISGDRVVVGARGDDSSDVYIRGKNSGNAYIFGTNGDEIAKLTAGDALAESMFGSGVAISGDHIVVGASGTPGPMALDGSGSVYLTSWHKDSSESSSGPSNA